MNSDVIIKPEILTGFLTDIFSSAGCSTMEAARISSNLVEANLTGHDSHGVIRTPRYLVWLKEGKLTADQDVSIVSENGPLLILDGNFGFGQTVGPKAVKLGIESAAKHGISIVALRHAGHLGRIGAFAETAAAAGQVSVHFVNVAGSVLVAPYGGTQRRLSTAPIAVGVPSEKGAPVILDFATSLVAEGKVLIAAKGGKPLPDKALIGPDGKYSSDPVLLYGEADAAITPDQRVGEGAITTMGDHKGSGLALICELLAGALTGSGATGPDYSRVYNGMLSIYMSVDHFDTNGTYADEIKRYVDYFKSASPIVKGGEVLVPGEPEMRRREERNRNGISLSADAWQAIVDAAKTVNIDAPTKLMS
ncbi:MAG: Ldh family oxidoreductase [Rhizobiaceae bacterium]|nr:Ldh family oxidoreductase [Rhizobiaceae bacterium]